MRGGRQRGGKDTERSVRGRDREEGGGGKRGGGESEIYRLTLPP